MSEFLHGFPVFLVAEINSSPHAVIAEIDLDGTANDETKPEEQRLGTTTPAQEAVEMLGRLKIPSGIITSRSFGEAEEYQKRLGTSGPTICEDGVALVLPEMGVNSKRILDQLKTNYQIIEHGGRIVVVLSRLDRNKFREFVAEVQKIIYQRDPYSSPLISTFSPTEEIWKHVGHPSLDFARRSAERVASAYIAPKTDIHREVVTDLAPKWGIRAFGDIINLIGEDANKGKALQALSRLSSIFFPGTIGIVPIIFGNNRNDLKVFEEADRMGGFGIMVGHPKGGFFIPESEIPGYVIKAREPYGLGMKQSIPEVMEKLNGRYSLR